MAQAAITEQDNGPVHLTLEAQELLAWLIKFGAYVRLDRARKVVPLMLWRSEGITSIPLDYELVRELIKRECLARLELTPNLTVYAVSEWGRRQAPDAKALSIGEPLTFIPPPRSVQSALSRLA